MVADLRINRLTGAGPTYTDITGSRFRFSVSDEVNPSHNNPITIPNPGQVHYSYWASLQLETLAAPDQLLDNVRIYTDGSIDWVGFDVKIALADAYVQATGEEGVSGDILNSTNHPQLKFEPVPLQNYTQDSPLIMEASTSTIEKFGEIIVLQISGSNQAVSGSLPPEALNLIWDET